MLMCGRRFISLIFLLLASHAFGQEPPKKEGPDMKSVRASLLFYTSASALDAWSSWGRLERNALLRGENGRFGAKGIAVKAGIVGGIWAANEILGRRLKIRKALIIMNCALGGAYLGAAGYNIKRQ